MTCNRALVEEHAIAGWHRGGERRLKFGARRLRRSWIRRTPVEIPPPHTRNARWRPAAAALPARFARVSSQQLGRALEARRARGLLLVQVKRSKRSSL